MPTIFQHTDDDGDTIVLDAWLDGLIIAHGGALGVALDDDAADRLLAALIQHRAPDGLFANDGRSPVDYAMAVSDWVSELLG